MQEASVLFGIVFDARKDQGPCLVLSFLGTLEDYSRTSFVKVVLAAKPERIDLLHNEVSHISAKRKLFSGIAASLRRIFLHIAAAKVGRTGIATLSALNDSASSPGEADWPMELEWDRCFALLKFETKFERPLMLKTSNFGKACA